MTLGGSTITNGFTSQEYLNPNTNTWTVIQTATMTPNALNDGKKICCQVPTLQPVCRTLAVQCMFCLVSFTYFNEQTDVMCLFPMLILFETPKV